MDYRKFRLENGIETKAMISAIREVYPKFSKATMSFADQPDKYGLRLLPSIERMLVERFGGGQARRPKSKPIRKKPKSLTVRISDELAEKVKEIKDKQGCTTQELLTDLIENWLITTEEI